jgi:hypothetical protein
MIVEKPAVGVSVYKKAFNPLNFIYELEKSIEDEWSEIEWAGSAIGPNAEASNYRTSLSASMVPLMPPYPKNDLSELFMDNIKYPIDKLVLDYANEYEIPSCISEFWHVLKYTKGAEYKGHYDKGPGAPRIFSMVAFLNTPTKGGHLEFPYFDCEVPVEQGTVILFPSCHPYLHIAHPVEEGIKYSLVTWYN